MKAEAKTKKSPVRRQPKQRRSRETVEAVLDAVLRILKREGIDSLTTNRIAEVAGVSVGSVYQYFPDKRAIFAAMHDRHVAQISRLVERTLVDNAAASLEDLMRALVEAMVDAHSSDPELHELLRTLPHAGDGEHAFEGRLRGAFRLAISSRSHRAQTPRDLDRTLFILPHMVNALAHGAAFRRPPGLSLAAAREEAVRAVLGYLRA
jgi:AcrR family transcriptional regulator